MGAPHFVKEKGTSMKVGNQMLKKVLIGDQELRGTLLVECPLVMQKILWTSTWKESARQWLRVFENLHGIYAQTFWKCVNTFRKCVNTFWKCVDTIRKCLNTFGQCMEIQSSKQMIGFRMFKKTIGCLTECNAVMEMWTLPHCTLFLSWWANSRLQILGLHNQMVWTLLFQTRYKGINRMVRESIRQWVSG